MPHVLLKFIEEKGLEDEFEEFYKDSIYSRSCPHCGHKPTYDQLRRKGNFLARRNPDDTVEKQFKCSKCDGFFVAEFWEQRTFKMMFTEKRAMLTLVDGGTENL